MMKKIFGGIVLILGVISCGGGGGGGNSSDDQAPADVTITADPTEIDSGDRMTVRVRIRDFGVSSIALKIRFPKQLRYIKSSAYLTLDDSDSRFDPTDTDTAGAYSYLVFYIALADLGEDEEGIISFELTGDNRVDGEEVEVDADVDDPDVSNTVEFKSTDPKFEAQDAVTVGVRGEPEPTPTSAPTATATPAS